MTKSSVADWDTTPGNNTDINDIDIAEGCAPSGINDAIRNVMSQVAAALGQPSILGLTDPGADRLTFWDDSAGALAFLTAGTGITITDTTMAIGQAVGTGDTVTFAELIAPTINSGSGDLTLERAGTAGIVLASSGGNFGYVQFGGTDATTTHFGLGKSSDAGSGIMLYGTATTTQGAYGLHIVRDSGANGLTRLRHAGTGQMRIECDGVADWIVRVNGVNRIQSPGGSNRWAPVSDNATVLGGSGLRWTELWAASATIQTSDETEKTAFGTVPGIELFRALEPVSWVYREAEVVVEATDEIGDDGDRIVRKTARAGRRRHFGITAQGLRDALKAVGHDGAGIFVDPSVRGEAGPLAWRPDEMWGPTIAAIKDLDARLQALEAA